MDSWVENRLAEWIWMVIAGKNYFWWARTQGYYSEGDAYWYTRGRQVCLCFEVVKFCHSNYFIQVLLVFLFFGFMILFSFFFGHHYSWCRYGNATVVENTERGWRDLILNKIRAVFGFGVWVFFIASLKCRISSIYLSAMKSELLNAWGLFWFLKTFLDNSVHTVVILLNCMSCHSCF